MTAQQKKPLNPFIEDMKSQRRGGFYWLDNSPYVSVTNCLSIIDKPALRYWVGKMVWEAMIAKPTLSLEEAMSAAYGKNKDAKERGTNVHTVVESYTRYDKKLPEFEKYINNSLPEDISGYGKAFLKWIGDVSPTIVANEKTVSSDQYKYAGTLDMIADIGTERKRRLIVDIKTGKDIYPEAYLQLSAYKEALKEKGFEVDGVAVLLLSNKGTYKFEEGEPQLDIFLAAQKIWLWKNQDLLNKLNQQGE